MALGNDQVLAYFPPPPPPTPTKKLSTSTKLVNFFYLSCGFSRQILAGLIEKSKVINRICRRSNKIWNLKFSSNRNFAEMLLICSSSFTKMHPIRKVFSSMCTTQKVYRIERKKINFKRSNVFLVCWCLPWGCSTTCCLLVHWEWYW